MRKNHIEDYSGAREHYEAVRKVKARRKQEKRLREGNDAKSTAKKPKDKTKTGRPSDVSEFLRRSVSQLIRKDNGVRAFRGANCKIVILDCITFTLEPF